MDKETIFKEIRNRAIKDDTGLGDIIYDVLNGFYPNKLKEYDLSVLDPRRGIMNPYDIIDVILEDASKEEIEQDETDDVDKQIEQKLKEIELLKQKKEELEYNDVLSYIKKIDFQKLPGKAHEVSFLMNPNDFEEEALNLLKSLKKSNEKQMMSKHFIAYIDEDNQYELKLIIDMPHYRCMY